MQSAVSPSTTNNDFQELILERMAERAEYIKKKKEKRKQTLKRIEEMKSKNGIHPLALFPKEIWMEILDKVNPKDKLNLYQIHPTFRDLLESTKIRDILFPLALAVMMNKIRNNQEYDLDIDGDDIMKSDLAPLIRLRQVSKSLRDAVDGWFEEEHLRMLPNYQSPNPEDNFYDTRNTEDHGRLTSVTFEICPKEDLVNARRERLKGLTENFRSTREDEVVSARKFFLRSFQIEICSHNFERYPDIDFDWDAVTEYGENLFDMWERRTYEQIYRDFKQAIIGLLDVIGDQIWYFKLIVDPFDENRIGLIFDVMDHYVMLQQFCMLMPNLKRLNLSLYEEKRTIQTRRCERIVLPKTVAVTHRFPHLKKLEKVEFEQGSLCGKSRIIYNAILLANPQIKMLRYTGLSPVFEKISSKALKNLRLESFMFGAFTPPSTFDFSIWKNILQDFSWPLKELHFRVKGVISTNQLFQFLEKFPSLEHVGLRLEEMEIGSEVGFLTLPNLTDFQIAYSTVTASANSSTMDINRFYTLQFLLPSKNLQHLFWTTYKTNDDQEATRIDFTDGKLLRFMKNHECHEKMLNFRAGLRDLSYSNVWNAFPKLEFLPVTFNVYSKHLSACGYAKLTDIYRRPCNNVLKESDIEFKENEKYESDSD